MKRKYLKFSNEAVVLFVDRLGEGSGLVADALNAALGYDTERLTHWIITNRVGMLTDEQLLAIRNAGVAHVPWYERNGRIRSAVLHALLDVSVTSERSNPP